MPRVFWVCAFVIGSVGQVCQGQSGADDIPVIQSPPPIAVPPTRVAVPAPSRVIPPSPVAIPATNYPPPPAPYRVQTVEQRLVAPVTSVLPNLFGDKNLVKPASISAPACPLCPKGPATDDSRLLIGFTAKWCGPCQKMAPILNKLVMQGYMVQQFDIDSHPKLAKKYQIKSIPAFVLITKGKEVSRIVGLTSENRLKKLLTSTETQSCPKCSEARATIQKSTAPKVEIACERIEFAIDPKTKQPVVHCIGGVMVKSDQFVVRAARLTIRNSNLLFEHKVAISLTGGKSSRIQRASSETQMKSTPAQDFPYQLQNLEFKPADLPASR